MSHAGGRVVFARAAVLLVLLGLVACNEEPRDDAQVVADVPLEFRRVLADNEGFDPWCGGEAIDGQRLGPAAASTADPAGRPPAEVCAAYLDFGCPSAPDHAHAPYLLTCTNVHPQVPRANLMAGPEIVGGLVRASAEVASGEVSWSVSIELDADGTRALEGMSRELAGTGQPIALVLEGDVLFAPRVDSVIADGRVRIVGELTQDDAEALARRLRGR